MHDLQQGSATGRMPGAGSSKAQPLDARDEFAKGYEKQRSPDDSCAGCVGEHDVKVCFRLPAGCSYEGVIWVYPTSTPLQQYHAALEQDVG